MSDQDHVIGYASSFVNKGKRSGRKIRKATESDRDRILRAIELLKEARELAKEAGAIKSLSKIRSAIKSLGGALRHTERAIRETEREKRDPLSPKQTYKGERITILRERGIAYGKR